MERAENFSQKPFLCIYHEAHKEAEILFSSLTKILYDFPVFLNKKADQAVKRGGKRGSVDKDVKKKFMWQET